MDAAETSAGGAGYLRNQFLVAMPSLDDEQFGQTVTLLCEHNNEGALGLVVNDEMIAVDTGCVWGRQLTSVQLTGKPKVSVVQCKDVSS